MFESQLYYSFFSLFLSFSLLNCQVGITIVLLCHGFDGRFTSNDTKNYTFFLWGRGDENTLSCMKRKQITFDHLQCLKCFMYIKSLLFLSPFGLVGLSSFCGWENWKFSRLKICLNPLNHWVKPQVWLIQKSVFFLLSDTFIHSIAFGWWPKINNCDVRANANIICICFRILFI